MKIKHFQFILDKNNKGNDKLDFFFGLLSFIFPDYNSNNNCCF